MLHGMASARKRRFLFVWMTSTRRQKMLLKQGAFTVSIADAENVVSCDYVGSVSGNKEPDKIKKAGWHATKSECVNTPLF